MATYIVTLKDGKKITIPNVEKVSEEPFQNGVGGVPGVRFEGAGGQVLGHFVLGDIAGYYLSQPSTRSHVARF